MSYNLSLEKYKGKVAVVTGASSGIGKAIAEGLVKYGVIVAGLARRVERIEEHSKLLINQPGKLVSFKTDLTKSEEIISTFKKVVDNLGPITILINNGGVRLGTSIIDGDIGKWKTILDTNILGLAVASREAIKSMKAHNIKGHIININSVVGHIIFDYVGASVYPASKFAVTALTETLRLEINKEKLPIKISSLSPGGVKTEFKEVADGKEVAEKAFKSPALIAEDVADAAFYILATPDHVNVKELTISVQGQLV
ncbi:farnesol dehydrogenase-like [Euwallacea fornicatus]|uniref:farnesol dehydrogenase-like n=1 Tax=Euwallacea fornicatus TaxID=995702 RepID=UPI00338F8A66